MASKKTLMVNFARSGRRRWSLTVEGTDTDSLDELAAAISNAKGRGIAVVNAADPFGGTKPSAQRKEKARKQRSDKGAKRKEQPTGDGHAAVGSEAA